MSQKIIKFRLFTWFENVENPVIPDGTEVRMERLAHLGEDVDISDAASLARGEELGAFFTDEEADAIRNGTYNGVDAEHVYRARNGQRPASPILPAEGEGVVDVSALSAEELGDYISANKLSIPDTLALIPEGADLDVLDKFADAENHATDNAPRKGVTDALEAKMAAAAQS